jgi:integrase/recombinase XerD
VKGACEDFIDDAKGRMRESSLYKYKLLLKQLEKFAEDTGIIFMSGFDLDRMTKFRQTWKNTGTAAVKKLEALRTLCKFCVERGWMDENYAKQLRKPEDAEPDVEPFTRKQVQDILAAIRKYPDKENAVRLKALILLLRFSGLRIGDAVTLDMVRIEEGSLFLRTEKKKTRVRVPLTPETLAALDACPKPYPFWSGASTRKSVIGNWQRAMKRLFKLAGVKGGHPHRWRHTFACELLLSGASLNSVAQTLGHKSERITEKHCGSWVKEKQEKLEAEVRKSWLQLPS